MSGGRYGRDKAPERRCLPVALWPAADRAAWEAAITPTSILEDSGGELTYLKPISQAKTAKGWGRFLSHLHLHDPEALNEPAPDRLRPKRLRAYVRRLQELDNSTATISCRLQELSDAAKILAPELDLRFLRRLAAQIRATHRPARPKHNRVFADEVVNHGEIWCDNASKLSGVDAAVLFRDGLILLLLAFLPLRRKNFSQLTLGQSLMQRDGHWFVTLTPEDTKTHSYFEAILPKQLISYLETYLAVHRPVLLACRGRWYSDPGNRLWLSTHGSAMKEIAIYDRVARYTLAAFGEVISPHRFRDMLASTIASHAPEHVHSAAPLLGHASIRTTEKYYRQAWAQEGQHRYVATLAGIRRTADG